MESSRRHSLAWLLPLLFAGCSVDPPPPPEADPELAALVFAPAARPSQRLAVSLSASGLGLPAPAWGVATVGSGAEVARVVSSLPAREYAWDASQVDQAGLLAAAADGLVRAGARVAVRCAGSASADELLEAAESGGAELLVHLDLRQARSAWVERGGFWWWFDLAMFYVPGIYPIVLVPDEVYEVSALARVQVVHVQSGRVLLQSDLVGRAEDMLNDAQRGWSLGGLLFLHPWTLDEDDYQTVFEALWPHAQRALEKELLRWLVTELPGSLAGAQELLSKGDPARARTLALVIGAPGPAVQDGLDRPPPLRGASSDAQGVAALLRESGEVARERDLVLLHGPAANRERVLGAARDLAGRLRPGDRLLVHYSGYGLHDARGRAALLLDGTELPLHELAGELARAAAGVRVTWVLDTSFAGAGGRTWPGAPVSDPAAALAPIRRKGWDGLLASNPGQVALESGDKPGGALTTWLLQGARGPADEDGDGSISLEEMDHYLGRWLTPEVRERQGALQTPRRLGEARSGQLRLLRVTTTQGD